MALLSPILLSACSLLFEHYVDPCNSHAYTRTILADYISTRFHAESRPRLGIVPFSTQANFAGSDLNRPNLGNEIAWRLQAALIESGDIPIVEVFNRPDWPGKKEEFFTGNFGALALARQAGYDLVLVGYVDTIQSLDKIVSYAKVIDVESGVTIYYGKATVGSFDPEFRELRTDLLLQRRDVTRVDFNQLAQKVGECFSDSITNQDQPSN